MENIDTIFWQILLFVLTEKGYTIDPEQKTTYEQ